METAGPFPAWPRFITVANLIALYRTNELPFHLKRALDNGVTRDEIAEVITHLAFYAGWPTASTAVNIAQGVFKDSFCWVGSSGSSLQGARLSRLSSDL